MWCDVFKKNPHNTNTKQTKPTASYNSATAMATTNVVSIGSQPPAALLINNNTAGSAMLLINNDKRTGACHPVGVTFSPPYGAGNGACT